MAIQQKPVVTMSASGKVISHARTDIAVRDLTVTVDEPKDRGGTNMGASPTESVTVALIGCLSVIAHRIADPLGIDLQDMTIDVSAQFDRRAIMTGEDVKVPFPEMNVDISVKSSAPDDKIEQLKQELARKCPVSTMIRQSGTRLTETWHVTRI